MKTLLIASTALCAVVPIAWAQPYYPTYNPTTGGGGASIPATTSILAGSGTAGTVQAATTAQTSAQTTISTGTSTARSLAARGAEVKNALDFGLVCDGATDNASVIAALAAASGVGVTLYFPPAAQPCLTSANLQPANGTTVWAYPGTVTLKPTASSTANPLLINTSGAGTNSNILIYGLTLDGGGTTFATSNRLTLGYGAIGVVYDHAQFQNTRGIAVEFSGSMIDNGVRYSIFTNVGNYWKTSGVSTDRAQAISFDQQSSATGNVGDFVENSLFSNIGLDSISAYTLTAPQFSNNICNLTLESGSITASAYAACIYAVLDVGLSITGNISTAASGNAFDLDSDSNINVVGNTANGSGQAGIGLFAITGGVVAGNTTTGNYLWSPSTEQGGITISTGVSGSTVSNLSLSGNMSSGNKYGIQVISGVTMNGLWVDPSNVLQGNTTSNLTGLAPLISTGSGSIDVNATNARGTFTESASETQFVLTFESTFTTPPNCVVVAKSGNAVTSFATATATYTTLTVNHASGQGVYSYVCSE